MALPTTEKTDAQYSGAWGYFRSWLPFGRVAEKATEGSNVAERKNDYVTQAIWHGCGIGGTAFDARVRPGTFETYRAMMKDPAIALASAAVILAILAAEWIVEADEDLNDDTAAAFGKDVLDAELVQRRATLLRDALDCLYFGFQPFEPVYAAKNTKDGREYVGYAKVKYLAQEQTSALVDDHGNLLGAKNGQVELLAEKCIWIVYGKRGDNWYGEGRNENCRRAWSNLKNAEDRKMLLMRLGTGIIVKVLYPPDTAENVAKGLFPNRDAALAIARALSDGQSVVAESLMGVDPREIANNVQLADKTTVHIETIDMGDPGPRLAAIGAEQDRLVKDIVRGWLQPERTLTEATMGGSRADSDSQSDIATTDAEATHD